MKKTIILMALVMITGASFAQTAKSTWLLGGSAGFNSSKQGDFKWTQFNLSPNAGYFFMNNLAAGLSLDFSSYKEENTDAQTMFSVGPFIRYYFVDLGPKAKLFGHGNIGFGSAKFGGNSEGFMNWGIKAGPAFFLNPSIALEATVGYGSFKYSDADDATNTFGVNVGFQIHLGK
ncbi:MAG TPA: hypothetical protein DEU93_08520 [Chitinophagaceae bacterium]|nr:hypothetical protein [Chitinophagaceae bacterium]HML57829.1 outer membrane beta-barrel protein [Ferruginibacter sp.]